MTGPAPQTTIGGDRPSVRAPLAAATLVSAVTLSVATFELAMADWPSGFVLLGGRAADGADVLRLRTMVGDAAAPHPTRRR